MNKNLIFDIGMHNGDDTAYYLSLGYKVISVDASPALVEQAKQRFEPQIKDHQVEVLNVGIAETEGSFDFYLNKKNSVWNSFHAEIGARDNAEFEIIKINTTSIDRIIEAKGVPYYLKIDIEGNDIVCLQSLSKCAEKPQFISVEVNDIDLILKLRELGYSKFKLIDQKCFLPMELPPIKEYRLFRRHYEFQYSMNIMIRVLRKVFRKSIDKFFEKKYKRFFKYDHPFGSSGPFGEALPGQWVDFETALNIYLQYKLEHKNSKRDVGYNFWIDAHASL